MTHDYEKQTDILIILLLLFSIADAHSRAEGGGGGGSGGVAVSGDGDGILGLLLWIILALPFPINLIVIAIIIVGFQRYIGRKKKMQLQAIARKASPQTFNMQPAQDTGEKLTQYGIQKEPFKNKVRKAFMDIQAAG